MWFGKFIGGFFGALLAGPVGVLIGIFVGHAFDRGFKVTQTFSSHQTYSNHTQAQEAFFNATFLVMGHIAKADGYISEKEIQASEAIMARLGLHGALKQKAISLFRTGKLPSFNLEKTLDSLFEGCHRNPILLQMFIDIQQQVAHADGTLSRKKQQVLEVISQRLGTTFYDSSLFETLFQNAYTQHNQNHYQHSQAHPPRNKLSEAYKLLGIAETVPDTEVKKAYRRLMSQNHPDKLIAKGLPEEMVKLATEKTQGIRGAYDLICKARGI